MGKVYSPELERMITVPDYCQVCGRETRRGTLLWVDETQYWACWECVDWAESEDIDLEEEIRKEVN